MRKRAGFLALSTAVIVSVFLFLISAAIMNYAYQSLRTEKWMAERVQRSLHSVAWSTAYFVLDTISGDLSGDQTFLPNRRNVFVSTDAYDNGVECYLYSDDISFDARIDGIDVEVRITLIGTGSDGSLVTVGVVAETDDASSTVWGQIMPDDYKPKSIDIIWR